MRQGNVEKLLRKPCKEDERCEEDSECHSPAKSARVCATLTDRNCNCGVCEGASRAVRQGAWTFPQQTEE